MCLVGLLLLCHAMKNIVFRYFETENVTAWVVCFSHGREETARLQRPQEGSGWRSCGRTGSKVGLKNISVWESQRFREVTFPLFNLLHVNFCTSLLPPRPAGLWLHVLRQEAKNDLFSLISQSPSWAKSCFICLWLDKAGLSWVLWYSKGNRTFPDNLLF